MKDFQPLFFRCEVQTMGQLTRLFMILTSSTLLTVPATASNPEAWAEHNQEVIESCLAISSLATPEVAGEIIRFGDDIGYDALLLQDSRGVAPAQLCLFNRGSRTAHVTEAIVPLPAPQTDFVLGLDAVGPITATTPFDQESIQALLPNYTVTQATALAEGEPYEILEVYDGYEKLLTINEFITVTVESSRVQNSLGSNVGTPFAEFSPQLSLDDCFMGEEGWTGSLICFARGSDQVRYRFDKRPSDPFYYDMPPRNVLAQWQLVEIIW
ncbi:MAG: DUF1131 family protein [Cyanobacteria bacterium J06635_15]